MSRDDEGFRQSINDEDRRSWDGYAHARTVMDHEHRMIHDGMAFHSTHRVASLANGATYDILTTVPAGTFPHMTALLFTFSRGDLDIQSYEGATTSDDGTAMTQWNRNRNSLNTPNTVHSYAPTVTDPGTLFHDRLVHPTGTGVGNAEGIVAPNLGEEWILKPSTKYLMRLTNNSGGAVKFTFETIWYEISYES